MNIEEEPSYYELKLDAMFSECVRQMNMVFNPDQIVKLFPEFSKLNSEQQSRILLKTSKVLTENLWKTFRDLKHKRQISPVLKEIFRVRIEKEVIDLLNGRNNHQPQASARIQEDLTTKMSSSNSYTASTKESENFLPLKVLEFDPIKENIDFINYPQEEIVMLGNLCLKKHRENQKEIIIVNDCTGGDGDREEET